MSDHDPGELSAADTDALLRWRLALGPGAEKVSSQFGLAGLSAAGTPYGIEGDRMGELDDTLSFVYGDNPYGVGGPRMFLPKWLGLLRDFFDAEVVALVQKDAIEKKGLTQLLFEPETLPYLEKNVELVTLLLGASNMVPDAAKAAARQIVAEVVEELRKKLESQVRTAVIGAVRRNTDSPLKVARNIDWRRTIRRNLKGWDSERRRLIADRFYFWSNQRKQHEWEVSILVDQSGSMAESAVYSSVMAAIFASLDVLRTHLAFFNERDIVDMTPVLSDPVEVLFSAKLGGAEDLNRAVAYAEANFIEQPHKTILLLVTDLYDTCGDVDQLVMRMQRLVESKVKALVLLKLSDSGRPSYNHELAARLQAVGVYCFGCTPKLLIGIMERVMKNQDISGYVAQGKPEQ